MTSESGGGLPFPLAYVWGDFESFAQQATDDPGSSVLAVYHLLDAVEVSTRFLLAVATAELDASGVEVEHPERGWLGEHPAFGTWMQVLEFTTKELSAPVIVSRVGDVVVGLRALVEHEGFAHRDLEVKNLIGLRNWMAHGGVLTEAVAKEILEAARPAVDEFLVVCTSVFAGVGLGYVGDDGSAAAVDLHDDVPAPVGLSGQGPGLYIGREGQWLQIWPLVRHAPPGRGEEAGRRLVTQVFVRLSAVAEYATLDPDTVAAFGRAESRAYRERFTGARSFWAELEDEAEGLIGRADELARVFACLETSRTDEIPSPWWLSGPMGQGKSALAAAVVVELRDRGDQIVVAHFFRSGDQRCNLRSFVAQALDVLDPEGEYASDTKKALAQLKTLLHEQRPTVICDGVDELTRSQTATPKDLDTLFQLSGSGGVWLFTGRSDLDPVAEESGLQKVFDPALPPMTPADLRGLVVSLAPQTVRDAILLRDRQGQSGDLDNPYASQLAERAKGLPLYVVLMLEWLASMDRTAEVKAHIAAALEDPEGTIPAGLSALYAKLVEGWGLGVTTAIKTPLLCVLAAAAEPLDAASLAELCFQRPAQNDEETSRRVTICEEILTAFSPVLWSAPVQDGVLGWRIRHDSFRGYLADSDNAELRPVFDEARYTLATRGAEPEKAHHLPLTRHLYRHGIGYLRADLNHAEADHLLSDFPYLYGRLVALGPSGVDPLLVDYGDCADPMCQEWATFLRTIAHFLRREIPGWGPERSLHQLAYDVARGEVGAGAREWSELHGAPSMSCGAGSVEEGGGATVLEGHLGNIGGACQLADGRLLSWSTDGTMRIWDLGSGTCVALFEGDVRQARQLADSRILTLTSDDTAQIWDPFNTGRTLVFEGARVSNVLPLADGRILSWYWGRGEHALRIWDPHTGTCSHLLRGHSDSVIGVLQQPNGRILSWSKDESLRVWDPDSGACVHVLRDSHAPFDSHNIDWATSVLPLAEGRVLAWSFGYSLEPGADAPEIPSNRSLRVWDLDTGACAKLEGHTRAVTGALQIADSRVLSWSRDATLRVWDLDSGACTLVLKGHDGEVGGALVVAEDRIVSWSEDATLRVWDLDSGACTLVLKGQRTSVREVRPLRGDRIVSRSFDDTIRIWDLASGTCIIAFDGATAPRALPLADGRVVSWSKDATLRVWDLDSTPRSALLEGHPDRVQGAFQLGDGRIVSWSHDCTLRVWKVDNAAFATAGEEDRMSGISAALQLADGRCLSWATDGTLGVWEPQNGTLSAVLEGHRSRVRGALQLTEGRILSWSEDAVLRIWDLDEGTCVATLSQRGAIRGALELTDGRILSWQRQDDALLSFGTLRIWDEVRAAVTELEYHLNDISGALQLIDGRILSWSVDATLRIWDPETGKCETVLNGHDRWVKGALQLADRRILSWSSDRTLRIWDADSGACVALMDGHNDSVRGALQAADGRIVSWSRTQVFSWYPGYAGAQAIDFSPVQLKEVTAGNNVLVTLTDGLAYLKNGTVVTAWWSVLPLGEFGSISTKNTVVVFGANRPVFVTAHIR